MKLLAAFLFVATTGCVVRTHGYVRPAPVYTTATVSYNAGYVQPELVEVSPGVQVVYDYDEPVFYSDSYYWRYYGNTWYRSSVHNGGWTVYNDVPYSVRSVPQPHSYTHYRPANYTPHRNTTNYNNNNNGYRQPQPQPQGPTVRDHRTQPVYQPQPQPQGPTVRDHRDQPQPQPQGPVVRDHRTAPPPPPPAAGPTVRDHRH